VRGKTSFYTVRVLLEAVTALVLAVERGST
jgi:hypothetical protein